MDQAYAADLLNTNRTVSELRELAKELGVSRKRGDSKRKTAERIAAEVPDKLDIQRGMVVVVPGETGRRRTCDLCGGPMLENPSPLVGEGRWECVDCSRTIRRQD